MSSYRSNLCYLCNTALGQERIEDLATKCQHTFHRECAQKRVDKKQKVNCPVCNEDAALLDALNKCVKITPRTIAKNSSDQTYPAKSNEKKDHPATVSKETPSRTNVDSRNNWQCGGCSMKNTESSNRCAACSEPRYNRFASTNTRTTEEAAADEDKKKRPGTSSSIRDNTSGRNNKHFGNQIENDDYDNDSIKHNSNTHSNTYNENNANNNSNRRSTPNRSRNDSPTTSLKSNSRNYQDRDTSSASSKRENPDREMVDSTNATNIPKAKSKLTKETSQSSNQHQTTVYISELPSNVEDNRELEGLVQRQIEDVLNIHLHDIKCYWKLGVGFFRVNNNEDKIRLINKVKKCALNVKDVQSTIFFRDKLELVSYIVFDIPNEKKVIDLPTVEDVRCRWKSLHHTETPFFCEQISSQFSNIYRISCISVNETLEDKSDRDFTIKNQLGHVYFCASCSFLEDLPKSTTQNQLRELICKKIKSNNISPSSLYVQLNKYTNNACVIVTNSARKWVTIEKLYVIDKSIKKKDQLTYRLLLHSLPHTCNVDEIINHDVFAGYVENHRRIGENLILDITNKTVFENCVRHKSIKIGNKHVLDIEEYNGQNNPEENEIDADTWYEAEMLRYDSDIMQFIDDLHRPIFRYKWNPEIWLEQFNRSLSPIKDNRKYDKTSHLLRMTVMLNTIGVVHRKQYTIEDQRVKLNIDKTMKTIVYDGRSKLKRGETIKMMTRTPFKSTSVHVVNEDCLHVYERLKRSGKQPLLLNMANVEKPGGGYRQGDEAQEENFFRRSDYFRSLDLDLDKIQQQQPERFRCSSNGQLQLLSDHEKMYEMAEFGAIYTSGVTVFRQPENTGYAYMKKPLENVCILAMSAYREPELEGKKLAMKFAVGMRKKIENILSIAYHHTHDCLVLSAFGCGAFKNPPDEVAKLFLSVIEQYAGFFEVIEFAIVDDHNTGSRINPDGNFEPFRVLNGVVAEPIIPGNTPNAMLGPYRLLFDGSTVSDICICDKSPCHHGAKCNMIYDTKHASKFSHPPLCAEVCRTGTCKLTDDTVHMWSWIHRSQCRYGGECRQIDDEKHAQEFDHPSYCSARAACEDLSEVHLKSYRHLPLCEDSLKCLDLHRRIQPHSDTYRHCKLRCSYGNSCAIFHNKKHMKDYQHPFPSPCPLTPFHCKFFDEFSQASDTKILSKEVQQHCFEFAHVCRFGRNCLNDSSLHLEKSIHVVRCICPYGDSCNRLVQEDHLNSLTHPGICDMRRPCKFAEKCHDRKSPSHTANYRHNLSRSESGIVRFYDLNNGIDFVHNQTESIKRVSSYVENQQWQSLPSGYISREIMDWIRTVQPVHRCNSLIFESILLHGHVMSRAYMENLKIPKFVATSVLQHSRTQRIEELKISAYATQAKDYITALVEAEFAKFKAPDTGSTATSTDNQGFHYNGSSMYSETEVKKLEKALSTIIKPNDMEAIRTKSMEIAQASIKLHSNPTGIGFGRDAKLGTDKTVFSVLGPNLGHYYGDVFIVFKREILHHPDANFSIQAATSFASGNAFKWRPWLGTDSGLEDDRIQLFHNSKLHPSVPGYEYAAALELIAITSKHFEKKTMDIDLQTILQRWLQVDAHQNIEAHLPQLIPLSCIDHIYMTQNIFDSLDAVAHTAINAVFKKEKRITITEYEGSKISAGSFGPKPAEQSRVDYQTFVVDELIKRFGKRSENSLPRPIRGAVITLPPTNLNDHIALPLTISQAYSHYCYNNSPKSIDKTTYIYWQVMHGDMMLTLSKERDLDTQQLNEQCLVCYVAAIPEPDFSNYHENASYINSGSPFKHHHIIKTHTYVAHSKTFYVGCNTNEFMTFCLEIQSSTGKVILYHAGPNSIYNHEQISHTFDKSKLDLAALEFVHVSAGSNAVPVQNLIVCFEKDTDLHPTIDNNFKRGCSPAVTASNSATSKKNQDHQHGLLSEAIDNSTSVSKGFFAQAKNCFGENRDSSLIPCTQNVNCLLQYSVDAMNHNSKYSHPCRFSELCRAKEPQLTHEPHPVPICTRDQKCNKLDDPYHRASSRHTDMPDFLCPCRFQTKCRDKSEKHRIKYSHGEQVFKTKDTQKADDSTDSMSSAEEEEEEESETPESSDHEDNHNKKIPCKWGSRCRDTNDQHHCRKYSHPTFTPRRNDHQIPCKWGTKCHDSNSDHRKKYSHPTVLPQRNISSDEEDDETDTF